MAEMLEGFAQRLRELRRSRNLPQTELGQLAALQHTHIGRFERGTSRPWGNTLKRLANAPGVTSDDLPDGAATEATKAHFEDPELRRQFEEVEQLNDEDKNVVKRLFDAFPTNKQPQTLAR